MVDIYARLGVRIAILGYNSRNAFGDGCQEPGNAGLSMLRRRFVREMNRAGVMIDLSHVGVRTALDTIAASAVPVLISHSNPTALRPHARNVSDEMIMACADQGGVIGKRGKSVGAAAGQAGRSRALTKWSSCSINMCPTTLSLLPR